MKNYTKLMLVVLAVLSSLCFLFYKFKYDRLYNIIQVLEVFGSPAPIRCGGLVPGGLPGAPSWRGSGSEVYVYSAQCTSVPGDNGTCPQVSVLTLTAKQEYVQNLNCKLWYEGSLHPLQGTFSFSTEEHEGSSFLSTVLSCETRYAARVPFGVSFYKSNEDLSDIIPVFQVPFVSSAEKSILQICVLPPEKPGEQAAALKEFFLLHAFLGVKEFIVYSPALPHSFIKTAIKVQAELNVQVRHFPWSPPVGLSQPQQLKLITQSCYYNSKHAENYILLQHNHLLLPNHSANLTTSLSKTSLEAGPNSLEVRKFCSEYPNDPRSAGLSRPPAFLQSTHFNTELSKGLSAQLYHAGPGRTSGLTSDSGLEVRVHEYGPCQRFDISELDDTAVHDPDPISFIKSFPAFIAKYQD